MERKWLLWLGILYVAILTISNVVAGKVVEVSGSYFSIAIIIFPLTYILGDVITEVYGFPTTRKIIWGGLVVSALVTVPLFALASQVPASPDWLLMTPRVVLASFAALAVGEFLNSTAMSTLKIRMRRYVSRWIPEVREQEKVVGSFRYFSLRAVISSVPAHAFDTAIFTCIAFYGSEGMTSVILLSMIKTETLIKLVYEFVLLPATYTLARFIKSAEGIDTYDEKVSYNPFKFKVV